MGRSNVLRCAYCFAATSLLILASLTPTRAASPTGRLIDAEQVELFAALDAGQIEVNIVPRDSARITMQVENLTEGPLLVRLPAAAVAVPVLAQHQQGGFFGRDNNRRGNAPQRQGIGFPNNRGGGNPFFNANGNRFGNGFQLGVQNIRFLQGDNPLELDQLAAEFRRAPFDENGLLSVPAGRTIRIRLDSVCLEYGKSEPRPRIAYELRPLETFSDDPILKQVLAMLPYEGVSQREIQIASWHLASDMSWEDLDALRVEHLNGRSERRFETAEIDRAREIVDAIIPPNESKSTGQ